MRINTNTAAMNTYSNLTSANASKSGSLAKLSSGLRINKAGDDAAGLAISEKMKNQISGMTQASRNAQDGISLIQTAEGALSETHSILNRMRDLTVQASSDTNTQDDRGAIQKEIDSLKKEVTRIAETTTFNTKGLMNSPEETVEGTTAKLDTVIEAAIGSDTGNQADFIAAVNRQTGGTDANVADAIVALKGSTDPSKIEAALTDYNNATAGTDDLKFSDFKDVDAVTTSGKKTFTFQIGANAGETIDVELKNMTAKGLNLDTVDVDIADAAIKRDDATTLTTNEDTFGAILETIDNAIENVSDQRADLGAVQNRLDHTVSNLATTKENLSEANSRITDVDMAEEMMSFTKSNILSQAATSMLAQANQMPQSVLSLLQ